eukprot:11556851-Alexandrium_andersonii.AAC.1
MESVKDFSTSEITPPSACANWASFGSACENINSVATRRWSCTAKARLSITMLNRCRVSNQRSHKRLPKM